MKYRVSPYGLSSSKQQGDFQLLCIPYFVFANLLNKCYAYERMARARVKPEFRSNLSEKLMDLGNLTAVALVLGQFIAQKDFSIAIFFWGLILTILCYVISYLVSS